MKKVKKSSGDASKGDYAAGDVGGGIVIPLENYYYEGHPASTGPALTNDLCGQNVKTNVKSGFDFNILTALKGWVGHAPQGRGALLIIFFYFFDFYFDFKNLKILMTDENAAP